MCMQIIGCDGGSIYIHPGQELPQPLRAFIRHAKNRNVSFSSTGNGESPIIKVPLVSSDPIHCIDGAIAPHVL
jgi:hypothetical protein